MMSLRLDQTDYTIGWVCALPSEFAAAVAALDERHPPILHRSAADDNTYQFGRVGHHNIVIACLPSGAYGITSAAIVATKLQQSFQSIKLGLMVGIGGGAPILPHNDIRLGDVIVSEPGPEHITNTRYRQITMVTHRLVLATPLSP
ncbi:hypothetical protein TWF281_001342 [Arthrobotrys megalospora]